jgi:hypothetical protein
MVLGSLLAQGFLPRLATCKILRRVASPCCPTLFRPRRFERVNSLDLDSSSQPSDNCLVYISHMRQVPSNVPLTD